MAIAFGAEAIVGAGALLPTVICALSAYLVIEFSGEVAFSDTVIEKKVAAERKGRGVSIVEAFLEVKQGSFADGKELRDLLLPPSCVVLSVRHAESKAFSHHLGTGDVLHVRYQTFDASYTTKKLYEIFGEQGDTRESSFRPSEKHNVPET